MSKEIVVPGEMLGTDTKNLGSHTFALDGKVYADILGLKNESDDRISVVPLRGRYTPQENDVIIGVVKNEKFAGYDIEINSFYGSFVNKQDLRDPLKVGDIVSAKIVKVNEMNEADVGMVRKLNVGEIVSVTPVKVPRIIGKNASMLNAVKNGTGANIMVGRNGLVWVNGGNTQVAVEAIQRIEDYAHVENLTQDIQHFLAAKTGGAVPGTHGPMNEEAFESGFEGGGYRGGGRGGFRGGGGRGGFDRRGPPRSGGGGFRSDRGPPRFGSGGGNRGGGFRSGGGDRGGFSDRPRTGGFNRGPRPMGGSGERDNFRPNNRFGSQYDSPRPQGGGFDNNRFENRGGDRNNTSGGFDRRKRFPRNDRVSGHEDTSFD